MAKKVRKEQIDGGNTFLQTLSVGTAMGQLDLTFGGTVYVNSIAISNKQDANSHPKNSGGLQAFAYNAPSAVNYPDVPGAGGGGGISYYRSNTVGGMLSSFDIVKAEHSEEKLRFRVGISPTAKGDWKTFASEEYVNDLVNSKTTDIKIGGRNYILGSDKYLTDPAQGALYFNSTELPNWRGKTVTVSADIELVNATGSRIGFEVAVVFQNGNMMYVGVWYNISQGANVKGRISTTHDIPDLPISHLAYNGIYIQCNGTTTTIGRPKLEFGNKATDWTPAIEDQFHQNFDKLETINQHVSVGSPVQFGNITATFGGAKIVYDMIENYGSPLTLNANASLGIRLQANGVTKMVISTNRIDLLDNASFTGTYLFFREKSQNLGVYFQPNPDGSLEFAGHNDYVWTKSFGRIDYSTNSLRWFHDIITDDFGSASKWNAAWLFIQNFNPNNYIPTTHPVYNVTQANINGWQTYLGYEDIRYIYPDSIGVEKLKFGFTNWFNNGNQGGHYADFLHFGGYHDSSGGVQNLIMFSKMGFGLRQYQGTHQSPSKYQSYVDYWHTGNFNPADKVDVMENAVGIGFSYGSSTDVPYFYHKTDGYVFLATEAKLNLKADTSYVNSLVGNFFEKESIASSLNINHHDLGLFTVVPSTTNLPAPNYGIVFCYKANTTWWFQQFKDTNGNIWERRAVNPGNVDDWQPWIKTNANSSIDNYAPISYVDAKVAAIPTHNGQLTVNTTADLVGGYVYLPSGNVTTTLGLATHILNAIADGQTAYSYGNHATQGYLKVANLAPYETTVSVNNKLSAKQDKLIAGANVSIVGNTISATDTDTITRIGVWGGNYTSGDINFTATGAATIVKNGNNINIDVSSSGGIPNQGVEVLDFTPGSYSIDTHLSTTIVRCTAGGSMYSFDVKKGKYEGDELCFTSCGYEYQVHGDILTVCSTGLTGGSNATRFIWSDQLTLWVQVA